MLISLENSNGDHLVMVDQFCSYFGSAHAPHFYATLLIFFRNAHFQRLSISHFPLPFYLLLQIAAINAFFHFHLFPLSNFRPQIFSLALHYAFPTITFLPTTDSAAPTLPQSSLSLMFLESLSLCLPHLLISSISTSGNFCHLAFLFLPHNSLNQTTSRLITPQFFLYVFFSHFFLKLSSYISKLLKFGKNPLMVAFVNKAMPFYAKSIS